ncbi:MAG TPA: arginase family protein [Lactovum miscens]|uniref:arginase family protein n=1 Tax=Lactovum miscens TaxID=190387 RepID=UPI002EDA6E1B
MNILIAKYDDGSRIPGARLAPIKLYEKYKIYGREELNFISIDIRQMRTEEKNLSKLGELINENKIQLAVGGDHSITYYCAESLPKSNSCLIIFDAHLDYFPNAEKEIKNWNFIEFLLHTFSKIIILGERNFEYSREKHEKITVFSSVDLNFRMDNILDELAKIIGSMENIYLSIDMDVLSSSEFSSVSYPVIGGIQMERLLFFIDKIISSGKVYFLDIVEYNPMIGTENSELFFQFVKRIIHKLNGGMNE